MSVSNEALFSKDRPLSCEIALERSENEVAVEGDSDADIRSWCSACGVVVFGLDESVSLSKKSEDEDRFDRRIPGPESW